jgi:hypothetical protein
MAQQALALAKQTNLFDNGRAWRVLGLVAGQLGEPLLSDVENDHWYDAAACFRRSLEFFTAGDFERDRAIALWRWAQYEMSQGNRRTGQGMWQEARDIFTCLNSPLMVARMESG